MLFIFAGDCIVNILLTFNNNCSDGLRRTQYSCTLRVLCMYLLEYLNHFTHRVSCIPSREKEQCLFRFVILSLYPGQNTATFARVSNSSIIYYFFVGSSLTLKCHLSFPFSELSDLAVINQHFEFHMNCSLFIQDASLLLSLLSK